MLGVPLAATAYAASRFRFAGRHWLLTFLVVQMFLVEQMFPFVALIVPLYNILLPLGLLGSVFGLVLGVLRHR